MTEAWDEGAVAEQRCHLEREQTGTAWGSGAGGSWIPRRWIRLADGIRDRGHTWDITDLVQDWQSGDKTNNGLMLASDDTGTVIFDYDSSESAGRRRSWS